MTDLIFALLLMAGATGAAELVRSVFRRQLTTPIRVRTQQQQQAPHR